MRSGLDIIGTRAESLARFMQAYARLARLPQPTLAPCELRPLVQRVVALETRLPVQLLPSPDLTLACDAAQIEQLVINLLKNAVEAALEQRANGRGEAAVRLRWRKLAGVGAVEILIEDDGPGIAQATNLFVPFFTTKSEGSGIGLVLCRQIAETTAARSRSQIAKTPAAASRHCGCRRDGQQLETRLKLCESGFQGLVPFMGQINPTIAVATRVQPSSKIFSACVTAI